MYNGVMTHIFYIFIMFEFLNNYMHKPISNAEQMSLFGVACISQWNLGLKRISHNLMESCIMKH